LIYGFCVLTNKLWKRKTFVQEGRNSSEIRALKFLEDVKTQNKQNSKEKKKKRKK
jgi:hypothetical protein